MVEAQKVYKVVFIRHGESNWNKENRFTGWTDVTLSETGIAEAKWAGETLKAKGYSFDVCFTSVLQRAITTFNNIAEELQLHHIPVHKSWRLNERHYGALQGLNKSETAEKHGEEQVKIWRRSYDIPPPPLDEHDERFPGNDKRYQGLPYACLPKAECLKDTVERVLPYWFDQIAPTVLSGQRVVVTAHGNSLRAIVKYLDNVSEKDILELNIPTGVPLVYELNEKLQPINHYYLASEAELKAKMEAVANQGKAQQK
jgi:2,3-bisphosphoglycerate-dependent phosphoglycerate mutase